MRQVIDLDQECGGLPLEGAEQDRFLDVQRRKSESRQLTRDVAAAERVGRLMRAVEQDVIPRLVSARRATDPRPSVEGSQGVRAEQIDRFVGLLLGPDCEAGPWSFVRALQADGVSVEAIYLELLAPAAQHVGKLWEDDLCTFVDVTLALSALHRILHALTGAIRFAPREVDAARRLLLVQPSGSTHLFGVQVLAAFFRRCAWSVDHTLAASDEALGTSVGATWFTVVGFSLASDPNIDALAATIRVVRRRSANRRVGILLGGPSVVADPHIVERVGADAMAPDAIQGVLEAERFVPRAAVSAPEPVLRHARG